MHAVSSTVENYTATNPDLFWGINTTEIRVARGLVCEPFTGKIPNTSRGVGAIILQQDQKSIDAIRYALLP